MKSDILARQQEVAYFGEYRYLRAQKVLAVFLITVQRAVFGVEIVANSKRCSCVNVLDGTAKVAHMLAQELGEFNALKKQEIAYILNIQPETLSRILKKLHRDGVITTNSSGQIEILNPQRLNEIHQ